MMRQVDVVNTVPAAGVVKAGAVNVAPTMGGVDVVDVGGVNVAPTMGSFMVLTSAASTAPPGPLPFMVAMSFPASVARRRALGEAITRPGVGVVGASWF